jgi:D-aminopeptidase
MKPSRPLPLIMVVACAAAWGQSSAEPSRPRARDVGLTIGILPTGPLNAITDVAGVKVGQATLIEGDDVRTGVTVIVPHEGNLFRDKVPGAVYVGNGFGKLVGATQVEELGEIETPIALTSTLSAFRVADALVDYTLALPGNAEVRSVNPLVGETNDGVLNDIRGRHVTRDVVFKALNAASGGAVDEGAVGAGTGTVAFGFKGGIGTSSRKLPATLGGYTVGVLVQSNYGGVLSIAGAPVGKELGRYYLKEALASSAGASDRMRGAVSGDVADGSIMMVVATDAPVDQRNLKRMAARAMFGLARTGSSGSNGSGDYAIAFSVAPELRMAAGSRLNPLGESPESLPPAGAPTVPNDGLSPLFLAVVEATEEAIYNSMFRATTTMGSGRTVAALPLEETVEILRRHGVLDRKQAKKR